MFTKIDHAGYFREIYLLEEKMLTLLTETIMELSDPETIKVLERIRVDEIKHVKIISEIEMMVNNRSN